MHIEEQRVGPLNCFSLTRQKEMLQMSSQPGVCSFLLSTRARDCSHTPLSTPYKLMPEAAETFWTLKQSQILWWRVYKTHIIPICIYEGMHSNLTGYIACATKYAMDIVDGITESLKWWYNNILFWWQELVAIKDAITWAVWGAHYNGASGCLAGGFHWWCPASCMALHSSLQGAPYVEHTLQAPGLPPPFAACCSCSCVSRACSASQSASRPLDTFTSCSLSTRNEGRSSGLCDQHFRITCTTMYH